MFNTAKVDPAFSGGLFGGITLTQNQFTHSFELGADYGGGRNKYRRYTPAVEATMKRRYNVSFSYMPGFNVNDKVNLHLLAGIDRSQFELNTNVDLLTKSRKSATGYSGGFGMDYNMPGWSVGGYYKHTWYNELTMSDDNYSVTTKPKHAELGLRLKIKI